MLGLIKESNAMNIIFKMKQKYRKIIINQRNIFELTGLSNKDILKSETTNDGLFLLRYFGSTVIERDFIDNYDLSDLFNLYDDEIIIASEYKAYNTNILLIKTNDDNINKIKERLNKCYKRISFFKRLFTRKPTHLLIDYRWLKELKK